MAQTKRKRRTKHRGNAAGIVEARGRTGRKPAGDDKGSLRADARARRLDRLSQAPTWRGAANRAAVAALIFGLISFLLLDQAMSITIASIGVVFLFYIPLGYYTDLFIYRRRKAKQES